MFTQSLIHVAILTYFAASSGHGIDIDRHIGKKAATKVEEKVVLRESPMSEKCGLGLETVVRPDKEIAALQSSARGLESVLALGERTITQVPEKAPVANRWKEKFVLIWDEQGGVYFHGTYYPGADPCARPCPLPYAFPASDPAPCPIFNDWVCRASVKCVVFSPAERGIDDAQRTTFKPDSRGRTPNDFFDFPDRGR